MGTETIQKVHYEIVEENCFYAIYRVNPDGSMKRETPAIYNHGDAQALAKRLNKQG